MLKISKREKRFILAGALAVLAHTAYVYVLEPAFLSQMEVREQNEKKRTMLERHRPPEPGKEYYRAKSEELKARFSQAETAFLKEKKTPLAAANLQGLLHKIGQETGLTIVRENVLPAGKPELFGEVAVELSVRGDIKSLRDFLYRVQTAPYLLTLPKLIIRQGPSHIRSNLTADMQVVGYIQGEEKN